MQDRLETADILPLVKQAAIHNLSRTSLDDVLFIITVLATALLTYALFNILFLRRSLSLTKLTLPTFFVGAYFLLMSAPAVLWFYATTSEAFRYNYFLAVQSVLVTLPIGVLIANAIAGTRMPSNAVVDFNHIPLTRSPADRPFLPIWLLMLLWSVAVAAYYAMTSSYVPLIGALTSYGERAASEVRSSVFWEGNALHYAHALAGRLFVPTAMLYAFFMSAVYKGRWRYVYWITLALSIFISSMTFDRTYPFSVVVFLGLAIYFRHQNDHLLTRLRGARASWWPRGRLWLYLGVTFALSMLVGGIISRTQYNQSLSAEEILTTSVGFLVDRVFLDASYMAFVYFEEFDKPSMFLYGQSIHVLVSWLFGVEFYPTISPSFVAELWINFGWPGVLFGGVSIGLLLQTIQLRLFTQKTIPTLSIYIVLLLNGAWIIYGHFLASMVISVYVPAVLYLSYSKKHAVTADSRARQVRVASGFATR